MTRRRLVILAVALVAAIGIAIWAIRLRTEPTAPTQYVPQTWQEARVSAMHTAHVAQQKIACKECHQDGFDGGPVAAGSCTHCHEKQTAHAHKGSEKSPTTCQTCHVFRGGESAKPCAGCHADPKKEGKAPLAHHANKDIACTTCHDVHDAKRSVLVDCTGCHQGASSSHGHTAIPARDAGVTFDAAVAFMEIDAGTVRELRAAAPAVAHPVDPAHPSPGQACSACHAPHTAASAARDTCKGCHVEPRDGQAIAAFANAPRPMIAPRGKNVAGHQACTTCHEPHRTTKADVKTCVGCHANRHAATESAKSPGGHTACTSCHAPHAPAEAKSSCASCHANVQALSAPKVKEHSACTSCHDPHEPKKAAALSCAKCHSSLEPKHPQVKGDPGHCVGCHTPHPKPGAQLSSIASACSSCHTKAKNDQAFHAANVACGSCHVKHDFALKGAAAGTALCAKCHEPVKQAVASRTGHAECRACHGAPHEPTKKPSCASCHKQETATAPKGHATCTSCHDAHSGNLGKNATCTNCHADKSKALHASGTPNGCASCHRPHDGAKGAAQPPSCTTCHDTKKLPGLHAKNAHATNCASCHTAHGAPKSERATCTGTCHADRRTHQPEATVCKGCHMFRR